MNNSETKKRKDRDKMELKLAELFPQEQFFAAIHFVGKNGQSQTVRGRLNEKRFSLACRKVQQAGYHVSGVNLNGHAVTDIWRKSQYDDGKIITWLQRNAHHHKPEFFILGRYVDKLDGKQEFCISGSDTPLVYAEKPWSITESAYRLEAPNIAMRISSGANPSPDKCFLDDELTAKIAVCVRKGEAIWR